MTYRQKLFGQMGYLRQLIEDLSLQYKKKFIWKFSATSHGKGVVHGIGANVKLNIRRKVLSMKKDRPIVKDSESFAELAQKLVPSTKIKHFSDEEIANYKKTNPFRTQFLRMVYFICMLRQRMDQRHNFGEILHTTRCERKQI